METSKRFAWKKRRPQGKILNATQYRFGCSATLLGHYIWVIGGFGLRDSYTLLDLKKQRWIDVPMQHKENQMQLHSANLFEDCILLFGVEVESMHLSRQSNELFKLDPVLKEVTVVPTYGGENKPEFRRSHSMELYEPEELLVLFGGQPYAITTELQLYLLDLRSKVWTLPNSKGNAPSLRERHGSCMVGSRLFVYSGDAMTGRNNDLYTVTIARNTTLIWQQVLVDGAGESGRVGAGFKYVGNDRVIIFGGYCDNANSNDVLVIENLTSNSPSCHALLLGEEYSYTGDPPVGREAPRIVQVGEKLIILGGSAEDGASYYELSPQP